MGENDWKEDSLVEYNEDPVYYCKHCLSLKIKTVGEDFDTSYLEYCDTCGSTDIETTDIFTWEKMYEQKYGKNFLTGEEA